ncbi:MAG: response regulator transcription factor [Actinobacteria bacterium]|nr:MAG: response regulator transcription factor [Actinomycetota bacterium]
MTTILVVDDNEKIVEVLAEYLRADGYSAILATDGLAAVAAAAEHHPDLALVDIMLPGIDGLELTRRFQADGIPVILVTARSDEVDRLVGLEIGADDYITKPFSPREVVARVKAVLRRCSRQDDPRVLRVGDLSLDLERRSVRVAETTVELTRTEFDILATMAAHPGRVYTRLQLLEAASGDAFEGYERTVDAHIKNIRKKLSEDTRHPAYVRTVFGVGYKVEAS